MYGWFDIQNFPVLSFNKIKVIVKKDNNFYRYIREGDEKVEKIIVTKSCNLVINPIEPVNLPKNLTNFLYIELENPVFSEPKSFTDVYLTFPIEIGVFLAMKKSFEVLDIFSLQKQKYTLYGNPRTGIICRYWRSDVYSKIPELDPIRNGVLKLKIVNNSDEWVEIKRIVLDVYGMKIYYNESLVFSSALMNIVSRNVAETFFLDESFRDMNKSIELYVARRIPTMKKKFVMEWGL